MCESFSSGAAGVTTGSCRRRPGAFTLLEGLAVLLIIGALCGVVTLTYAHVKRGQLDTTGYQVLGAAQVDGRRVASGHGMTFPDQAALLGEMADGAGSVGDVDVTYQDGPSTGPTHVSVLRPDEVTVGFAVLTTTDGSLADGDASDGHCLVMVDSLRSGTVWASSTDGASGSTSTCAPAAAACPAELSSLPGAGTDTDPYVLPENFSCAAMAAATP